MTFSEFLIGLLDTIRTAAIIGIMLGVCVIIYNEFQ